MKGNTPQHTVRTAEVLWAGYLEHRKSIGSTASEGVRIHMIEELRKAGKLTRDIRQAAGLPE